MGGKKSPKNKTPQNKRRRRVTKKLDPEMNDSDSEPETSSEEDGNDNEPTNKEVIESVLKSQNFLSSKFDKLDGIIQQLVLDNATLKKEVQQLQSCNHDQQQQIISLSNEMQEVKQQLLQKDLVLTGLPNLPNINPDTILSKVSEIYEFNLQDIDTTEIITGISKINKKPFNMIFVTMRSLKSKRHIIDKQKSLGPIVWDQLFDSVAENYKTNKVRFNNRLTQYKQSILIEGKKFSKDNKDNVPFVWEKNGRILLKENNARMPITLKSLADLDLIKKKYQPSI